MNSKQPILTAFLVLTTALACMFVEDLAIEPLPSALPEAASPAVRENRSPADCLDHLNVALETQPFDQIGNPVYEELGARFDLVIYKVEGDQIKNPIILYVPSEYRKYQEDTAAHRRIWDFYAAIIPPELRRPVTEFVIFTDGPESDSGAWVRPSPGDPENWQVGFDLLDSDYPPFLTDALIHETAHILTLNSAEIPDDEDHYYFFDGRQNVPDCPQLVVNGSCSPAGSYINLFYQRFWKDIYAQWWLTDQQAQRAESDEEYWQMIERFYEQHSELFLNSYAATNIEEDLAESFTFFVLNDRPTGNAIPDQKAAFYYEFPELIDYRQQIVAGLCSYLE